jgi:hypothetical protein
LPVRVRISPVPDIPSDEQEERVPEAIQPGQASIDGSEAQRLAAPLTVIKAHAQLIRRRAKEQTAENPAALERSLEAIERAVQCMVTILAGAAQNPGRPRSGEDGASQDPDP